MANVVSLTGAGSRGAAGIVSGSDDSAGCVEILFDAKPWEDQPQSAGTLTLTFDGSAPTRWIGEGGWAVFTATSQTGNVVCLNWQSVSAPQCKSQWRVSYGG